VTPNKRGSQEIPARPDRIGSGNSLPAPRGAPELNAPARRWPRHASCRWDAIRYALDSNARTLRLCLITLVVSIPPSVLTLLIRLLLIRR
jgi:hypothetical protein